MNNCFQSDKTNYKVGKRFVYHAGGNNFRNALLISMGTMNAMKGNPLLPLALAFIFEFAKDNVRSESEQIVTLLKNYSSETKDGKRDVLVVGGYTAGSWFIPVPTDGGNIVPGLPNPLVQKKEGPKDMTFFLNVGLYLSTGLYQMEGDYKAIAEKQNVHYLSVWDDMFNIAYIALPDVIHPNDAGFRKWGSAVGKKLREIDFHTAKKSVRFVPTGNRYVDVEIELRLAKEELEEKLAEYEKKKSGLETREKNLKEIQEKIKDAEYKLSLIKQRIEKIDSQISETKIKIATLDVQIEEARLQGQLEQERILAEQKKQEEERLKQLEIEREKAEAERLEDVSAPYFKMYPRGWRGEIRYPIEVPVKIAGVSTLTKDLSLAGFYANVPDSSFKLNQEVEVELVLQADVLNLQTGIVRIDPEGVGFAFRDLDKNITSKIKNFIREI